MSIQIISAVAKPPKYVGAASSAYSRIAELTTEARKLARDIKERSNKDRALGLDQISDETLKLNHSDGVKISTLMQEIEALKRPPAPPARSTDYRGPGTEEQVRAVNSLPIWASTEFDLLPASESLHQSAQAHFNTYSVVMGVRSVNVFALGLSGYKDISETRRIKKLADNIDASKEIEPIFVGVDADGSLYIMEGQHRARAFDLLNRKAIPARVVIDTSDTKKVSGSFIADKWYPGYSKK